MVAASPVDAHVTQVAVSARGGGAVSGMQFGIFSVGDVTPDPTIGRAPTEAERMSVLAVGGYGRSVLAPSSDVDLLFLYPGKPTSYVETVTETVVARLIDAGFTVGHAMRSVAECMRLGRRDLPTLTSYLDARRLTGDPARQRQGLQPQSLAPSPAAIGARSRASRRLTPACKCSSTR